MDPDEQQPAEHYVPTIVQQPRAFPQPFIINPHEGFQPLIFTPAYQRRQIKNTSIFSLSAVAGEILPHGGNDRFLALDVGGNQIVTIKATPSPFRGIILSGGFKAHICIDLIDNNLDLPAKALPLKVKPGYRMTQLLDLIVQTNRHRYEFDSLGRGRRFWVISQLFWLLHAEMLADQTQVEEAKNVMFWVWPEGRWFEHIVTGSYYP